MGRRASQRSGRTERFGGPVEAAGLGAVERGGRLDQRDDMWRVGNDGVGGKNGMRTVADRVTAIGVRMARLAAIMGGAHVSTLARRLGYRGVVSLMVCGDGIRRGLRIWWQGVPNCVGIGAHDASFDQRERHHGCKQPRRPRFGDAAHRDVSWTTAPLAL